MEYIRDLITSKEFDRIAREFPLDSVLVTNKLILKIDKRFENTTLEDLNMNTEQFTKFTEIKYWLQLIEYDLACTHGCLVYLTYKIEKDYFKNTTEKMTVMDVQDFSFFFESALSKLFTLVERVAQFINCLFSLKLIEDKLGSNGVSIKNVIRKLQERDLIEIKECIQIIDNESEKLRKLRNAITHHFHPLNSPFYIHSNVNGVVRIDRAKLFAKDIINKELISSFQISFDNINDMINMLVGVAVGYFKIDCILIKDRTVVDATHLRIGFESLIKEDASFG
ncbi:Cthe_2314 family HEPN domain-containing protein [Paenibacillus solani]|uniref:Cthe-2314-like HEPN domain-containing protein n=1 Tax=Paenibacillus solani TaxID=1705565 RepID=A0A0M1NZA7_9BACL|nr:Cthe_2314 family HEPN domain-containing protein [Paenibacillus solani]KOR87598.1 hypothetical protein AM231_16980 [Paenibacillus solani]